MLTQPVTQAVPTQLLTPTWVLCLWSGPLQRGQKVPRSSSVQHRDNFSLSLVSNGDQQGNRLRRAVGHRAQEELR